METEYIIADILFVCTCVVVFICYHCANRKEMEKKDLEIKELIKENGFLRRELDRQKSRPSPIPQRLHIFDN